jgi:uncharacterized protein (DUF111 family)
MLAKHMNMQVHQMERLNKEIEVRTARRANLDIRNKWLQAKKIKNYQSEYDRIRSHMADSSVPFQTREKLKDRKSFLESLGAQAFDGIRN